MRNRLLQLLLSVILLTLLPARSLAQTTAPAQPGSELTVYLLTFGPGEAIYEAFGHNAIWIHDPSRSPDLAYNYGMFDMGESGFILRFLQGRMWYWMQPMDAEDMVLAYKRHANRSVWVQELNLTPTQRLAFRNYLEWNARPENAHYRYDYYTDNCSTRVRDALDRALDGQIRKQLHDKTTGHTYRWHTRRLTQSDPIMYTALNFILGQPIDRPISAWQESFLPELLMEHLRTVTVLDETGRAVPLIALDKELYRSTDFASPQAPPNRTLGYLLVGLAIGGLAGVLARLSTRFRAGLWGVYGVVLPWFFLLGGAGTFLAGAWLLTSHVAVYRNENLLHFNPLALPLLVLLIALIRKKPWAARPALWLTLVIAGTSVLGLLLKVFPAFYQVNGELIALTLPANLGMLFAVYQLTRSARTCR